MIGMKSSSEEKRAPISDEEIEGAGVEGRPKRVGIFWSRVEIGSFSALLLVDEEDILI